MKLLTKYADIQGRMVREDGLRTCDWYMAMHFTDGAVLVIDGFSERFGDDDAVQNVKELRELAYDTLAALGIDLEKMEEQATMTNQPNEPAAEGEPVVWYVAAGRHRTLPDSPATVYRDKEAATESSRHWSGQFTGVVIPVVPKADYDRERAARERAEADAAALRTCMEMISVYISGTGGEFKRHHFDGGVEDRIAWVRRKVREALNGTAGAALAQPKED